jgi:hypothetical protein
VVQTLEGEPSRTSGASRGSRGKHCITNLRRDFVFDATFAKLDPMHEFDLGAR